MGCDEVDLNQEIPDYPGEILMGCDRTHQPFCIVWIQTPAFLCAFFAAVGEEAIALIRFFVSL
jgi:hypothetical protein